MSKYLIIVDDELPDAASKQMLAILSSRGQTEIVALSSHLKDRGLELNRETGALRWSESNPRSLDPAVSRIYNRVIEVSSATADSFLEPGWRSVPQNYVWSAYGEALLGVPQVFGAAGGVGSPAGNLLPLNLQWHAVSRALPGVCTPRFQYNMGAEPVDVSTFRHPIRKSLFDIFDWSAEYVEASPGDVHQFVVDKPAGEPVLGYFVGSESATFALRSGGSVPGSDVSARLTNYLDVVRTVFRAYIGEVLFFVEGERITFGAYSHYLRTAMQHESFAATMTLGLDRSSDAPADFGESRLSA